MENEPDHSDKSFPDVVVAVGQPIREVEQVAHPHRDLEYFSLSQLFQRQRVVVEPQPRSLSTTVAEVETQGW